MNSNKIYQNYYFSISLSGIKYTRINTLVFLYQPNEETHSRCPSEDTAAKMVKCHQFRQLKDDLVLQVSASMARDLTVQTVFACLLYITNEKVRFVTLV